LNFFQTPRPLLSIKDNSDGYYIEPFFITEEKIIGKKKIENIRKINVPGRVTMPGTFSSIFTF